jgi:hypothetical protein
MGSMLPYIAAPWILWVGVFHSLDFSGEIRRVDAPTCAETGEICAICLAELAAQNEEARESGPTEPRFPWRNMREVWEVQILRTLLGLGWTQHVAGSWDQLKLPRKSLQHDNNATANTSWMILSNAHLASDHDATDSVTNGMRTSQDSLNLGIELLYFHVSRECLSETVWPPQCGSPKLGKLVSTRNCNNYRISGG